jgi:radical SAM superfamily enzyme YgiQ (UPF0313 family)
MSKRRVTLIYPPFIPYGYLQIYPSLPVLAGSLRAYGFAARQIDLNNSFLDWYLNSKQMSDDIARARKRQAALERKKALTETEYQEYVSIQTIEELYASIRENSEDVNIFIPDFVRALGIAVPQPSQQSELIRMTKDRCKGLRLIRKFYSEQIDNICEGDPLFFGVSVVMTPQVIPALILSQTIRRHLGREAKIFWGGPLMSLLGDESLRAFLKHGKLDGVICGEGEEAASELAAQLDRGKMVRGSIPNFSYLESGTIKKSGVGPKKHISEYPLPYYDLRELKRYRKITPVSILISRGCRWGKCAYCEYPRLYKRKQLKTPERAIDDLRQLVSRYPGHKLWLACDMLDAKYVRKFCRLIIKEKIKFQWLAYMRVEPKFTLADLKMITEAGCFWVNVGLESLDTAVLKRINKGYTADQAVDFLKMLGKSGIGAQVNMIIDLPGTTYRSALKQLDLLQSVLEEGARNGLERNVAANPLLIPKNAPMGICPKKYGIDLKLEGGKNRGSYINYMPYAKDKWMSDDERNELAERYDEVNTTLLTIKSNAISRNTKVRPSSMLNCERKRIVSQVHQFDPEGENGLHRKRPGEFVRILNMRDGLSITMPRADIVEWIFKKLPVSFSELKKAFENAVKLSKRADIGDLLDVLDELMRVGLIRISM